MTTKRRDIYTLPSVFLFIIGLYDLIRGFMHTYLLTWSASYFAKFDLATVPEDQVFMLGVFGISNWLTGFLYLLISIKAKHLSPYVLIIIPLTYLLGLIGIWSCGIHGQSAFNGQYFMYVYFAICVIIFLIFLFQKYYQKKCIIE